MTVTDLVRVRSSAETAWMGNCLASKGKALLPVSPVQPSRDHSWAPALAPEGDLSLSQRPQGPLGLYQCPDVRMLPESSLTSSKPAPVLAKEPRAAWDLSPDPVAYRAILEFPHPVAARFGPIVRKA